MHICICGHCDGCVVFVWFMGKGIVQGRFNASGTHVRPLHHTHMCRAVGIVQCTQHYLCGGHMAPESPDGQQQVRLPGGIAFVKGYRAPRL